MSRNCVPKSCKMPEIHNANFALPVGWQCVRLGEVCEINSIPVLPNSDLAKKLPYIGLEHIEGGTGRIMDKVNDTDGKLIQSNTFHFDSQHVLYGKLRPYLNKVAIPDFEGRSTTELLPLLPSDGCDRYYLAWLLRRTKTVEEAMRHKTGTRMPRADMDDLFKMLVPLPPLSEQKRIAAKIQELMQEVERARTACEKQLEAAKVLPAAYLQEVFKSEEAKKWERKRLGEVCEIIMGQSPPGYTYNTEGKGLPFYQGKIEFGRGHLKSPATWCSEPQKIAEPNDILISIRAPVGPTNMCNIKCCIGRGLAALRPTNSIESRFVFYSLRFIEPEICGIGQGSTFSAISKPQIQNLEIPFPSLPTQQRIATELKEKMAEVEKLRTFIEKQLEALDVLPQSILRKAFRGEL